MKQAGTGERVLFKCFFAAMAIFIGLSGTVWAGDHLSLNSPGCTKCHGDNVRDIHDYTDSIPLDCDICHAAGGPAWPVNDRVYEMFDQYYDVNPLEAYETGWLWSSDSDLPEFDFDCQKCHFKYLHDQRYQ